jgi:hypothetical protein
LSQTFSKKKESSYNDVKLSDERICPRIRLLETELEYEKILRDNINFLVNILSKYIKNCKYPPLNIFQKINAPFIHFHDIAC